MKLEISIPLQFVRLEKLGVSDDPMAPPGDMDSYSYGDRSESQSIPIGYWLDGWLLKQPVVGESVRVLRFYRNGLVCPGYFSSTVVTAVRGEYEFRTMNSVYRLTNIVTGS